MATTIPNQELFILQNTLLQLYTNLRQNAVKSGNVSKYNSLKALQADVQKAMFSNDIVFVQSVFDKVLALFKISFSWPWSGNEPSGMGGLNCAGGIADL